MKHLLCRHDAIHWYKTPVVILFVAIISDQAAVTASETAAGVVGDQPQQVETPENPLAEHGLTENLQVPEISMFL